MGSIGFLGWRGIGEYGAGVVVAAGWAVRGSAVSVDRGGEALKEVGPGEGAAGSHGGASGVRKKGNCEKNKCG